MGRKVIGWAPSKRADASLTCTAVQLALDTRQVSPDLIHHSDQGGQQQRPADQALLDTCRRRKSRFRRASPGENAKLERLLCTVKVEEVCLDEHIDLHHARRPLGRFLEAGYNHKRLRRSLGHRPPDGFEAADHSHQTRPPSLASLTRVSPHGGWCATAPTAR